MSDANLTNILYVKEATFGEIPAGPPKMIELRYTGSSLVHEKLTAMSQEIRQDRARSQLVQVGKNATGTIDAEFSIGNYDDFLLAALMAQDWTNVEETVSGDIVGNVFTRGAGTFSASFQGAQFVLITGANTAANNGIKRVTTWADGSVTVASFAGNEAGISLHFVVNYARNGVYRQSFTIEEQFLSMDVPHYIPFVGMVLNQWSLNMEPQAMITQSFDFMGTQAFEGGDSSTYGDGSPTPPPSRDICNTTGNVGTIRWNDAALTANILSFTMQYNNNYRNRPAIGHETTLPHGKGTGEPDGTCTVYFDDAAMFQSFVAHEDAEILMPIIDVDGNLCSIYMPHVQFASGSPPIDGLNTDVNLAMDFNATIDVAKGFYIQIDRLDVVTS